MPSLFSLLRPALFAIEPERAHNLTLWGLKTFGGLLPKPKDDDPILATDLAGLKLPNPVGLAAGFDKNAEVMYPMLRLGFGFVEAGTVTPEPQDGNPKPRIFRLKEDNAVINRLGFNNRGLSNFVHNLADHRGRPGIIGANVGANKDSDDRIADYAIGVSGVGSLADYFTINISSPNTPGLRALQSKDALRDLLTRVMDCRDEGDPDAPIFLKVAPDLTDEDVTDIASVVLSTGVHGIIVSNTTISRPDDLESPLKGETGGLSGAPLLDLSTEMLKKFYIATGGKIPLIGVGGIQCGNCAYRKIKAGATAVQVYSSLIYKGPGLVNDIKKTIAQRLRADGFNHISDAVGVDCK